MSITLDEATAAFNRIVDWVEARCMAVDGPVTPTLKEMREDELAELWRAVQAIRSALSRSGEAVADAEPIPCRDCGGPVRTWFAPNELWNLVMGGPEAKDDPGGILCTNCFIARAEMAGLKSRAWMLAPPSSVSTGYKLAPEEPIWPAPNKAELDGGWKISTKYLAQVAKRALDESGYDATWEFTERVLIITEARIRSALTATPSPSRREALEEAVAIAHAAHLQWAGARDRARYRDERRVAQTALDAVTQVWNNINALLPREANNGAPTHD